jgi:hypothetical protein
LAGKYQVNAATTGLRAGQFEARCASCHFD